MHEETLIVAKVVVHAPTCRVRAFLRRSTVCFERYIGHRVMVDHGLQVIERQVSFVRGYFGHREIVSGGFH